MITRGIREFMARDWAAVADSKRDYWAEQYRATGPDAARRAAIQLLDYARRLHPGFPSDADRATDLAGHIEIRNRLDRAARAFTGR